MTSAQEPAVDARAVAIEVIARAIAADVDESEDWGTYRWAGADALDVLLSPTKKPCGVCGEGWIAEVVQEQPLQLSDIPCSNPDCIDGFVLGPAPIEGLLEQVGWVCAWDDAGESITWLGAMNSPDYRNIRIKARVFRLPSKVREG